MKSRSVIIIAFLTLVIYFAGFHERGPLVVIETAKGRQRIFVEVARTLEQKQLGLMHRANLDWNSGMLFVFQQGDKPVMWMKNMNFPIDIIFADEDAQISHIEKNAEPCYAVDDRYCPRYRSEAPSRFVLELPAGFVERMSIQRGDTLVLPSDF